VTLIQSHNDDGMHTDGKTLLIWGAWVQSIGLWIMQFQITQFHLCTLMCQVIGSSTGVILLAMIFVFNW